MLGWAIADDHDVFSLDEMVAAFDVVDVNSNPARFDQKKADALNAEHIRMLTVEDFTARLRDYFGVHGHRLDLDDAGFATAADLVQTRIVVLGDAWDLLKFLNDDEYAIDPKAAAKELGPDSAAVLDAALGALDGVADWTTPQIEAASRRRSSTSWASNRARRLARSGWAPPGRRSARRCSSRSSCWAATAACGGCARRARRSVRGDPDHACGLPRETLVVCTAVYQSRQRLAAAVPKELVKARNRR